MSLVINYESLTNHVGAKLGPTEWMTIGQDRIDLFADATEDRQWIHVDAKAAADGPFGSTIAHGYLTLALVNKFMPELLRVEGVSMGVNYGCGKVRFPAAVPVNSRIRGVGELLSAEQVGGGTQIVVRVTVEIDGGERPACVVDTISRFYP